MELEVELTQGTTVTPTEMKKVLTRIAEQNPLLFSQKQIIPQSLPFPNNHYTLAIQNINVTGQGLPITIYVFKQNYSKPTEDKVDTGEEILSLTTNTILPSAAFSKLWDSIITDDEVDNCEDSIKHTLLQFMQTAIEFSEHNVCPDTVTCNRIIMLYGPPGTGKTTICKGLAQKLSIRLSNRFSHGILLEVNTHSLFSKWFAESGKMVKKLFDQIHIMASDPNALVFVLIDEVESIATARQSSLNGSDPSDAIRVVNALLTQIDQLRTYTNVMIMATSNLMECIDFAFLSRADIKQFIGNPCLKARYKIMSGMIDELISRGVLSPDSCIMDFDSINIFSGNMGASNQLGNAFSDSFKLLDCAKDAEGLSGRQIRRMPILARTYSHDSTPVPLGSFLMYLKRAIDKEMKETHKTEKND